MFSLYRRAMWQVSAPSNIALIKYMGKTDFSHNIPSNASLSYTLENLRTIVELELISEEANRVQRISGESSRDNARLSDFRNTSGDEKKTAKGNEFFKDIWEPLEQDGFQAPELSLKGQERFISFFNKLKSLYGVQENFIIRSANNFPSDSGMASSASSFAALTMVADEAFQGLGYKPPRTPPYQLSREGSGSSTRSFFSPWALWRGEEVFAPEIPIRQLYHDLVLVEGKMKEVSSGEAHKRIETSLLNIGRTQRAQDRLDLLMKAFQNNHWREAFEIVWAEFWDMHTLFETSHPPFSYVSSESFRALENIKSFWKTHGDGPLVTMDAGPNIHLLWRIDQKDLRQELFKQLSDGKFYFLNQDRQEK